MKFSRDSITSEMNIIDGLPILYLEDENTLVLTDLHLGIESIMSEDGTYIPHNQTQKLTKIVSQYVTAIKPKILVLNGDVKHSFHEPTRIENRDVKNFLQTIAPLVDEIHIIKGNHDIFLNWVTRNIQNASFHEEFFILNQYYFTHGDKKIPLDLSDKIKYVIIGHEHPVFHTRVNGFQKIRARHSIRFLKYF